MLDRFTGFPFLEQANVAFDLDDSIAGTPEFQISAIATPRLFCPTSKGTPTGKGPVPTLRLRKVGNFTRGPTFFVGAPFFAAETEGPHTDVYGGFIL